MIHVIIRENMDRTMEHIDLSLLFEPHYFTEEEKEKCQKFADASDNRFYEKRGQTSDKKKSIDCFVGKLGEVAAYRRLSLFVDMNEPDFEIYPPNLKSWAEDLNVFGRKIHAKSQNSTKLLRYPKSWTFQHGQGGTDKEVFCENPLGIACFIDVDIWQNTGTVRVFVDIKELHKRHLFKLPVASWLKDSKLCVYYNDIVSNDLHERVPQSLSTAIFMAQ